MEYRGEKLIVHIPDFVEETGISCPDCTFKCKTAQGLSSYRNFKHGNYIESASRPAASTSASDVPRPNAMNTASTSASDVPRPNAMNTASTSASDAPRPGEKIRTVDGGDRIDLTEHDAKRRRQKHDAEFKAEVLQKLAEGMTPNEAMSMYRSFNINKSQIIKWSKAKDEIYAAAADRQKKKLTKI